MTRTIVTGLLAWLIASVIGWTASAAAPASPSVPQAPAASASNAAAPSNAALPVAVPPKPPAANAPPGPPPSPGLSAAAVAAAQQTLSHLVTQAQVVSDDGRLADMGAQATAIQRQAAAASAALQARIAGLDQTLAGLAAHGRRRPTAAGRAQQAQAQTQVLAQRAALLGPLQQANVLAGRASATFDEIAERRREGFSARVLERSDSPLTPGFWDSLADDAATDLARLSALTGNGVVVALKAPEPRGLLGLVIGLAAGWVLALPARLWLVRLGRRKAGEAVHPGVARTGAALWVAATDTGMPALAAFSLHLGVQWGGLLSSDADAMAGAGVVAVAWGAAILALSRVLATDTDARHRLLPISDDAARRIRAPMVAVAVVTGAGFLLTRANYVVGASLGATIAANCFLSLAYAAVAGLILISFGRGRILPADGPADGAATTASADVRAPAWTLISLLLTTAILITAGAVLAGYTTLAATTSSQIFWLAIIAAITYLLLRFVDDASSAIFRDTGWASRALYQLFNLRRSTIRQTGVLASAALQLVILMTAVSGALTPFGEGGQLLFADFGRLGGGVKLGAATISPTAIAAGLAAMVIGMALVHALQRWVVRRYLPVTDWDAGLRNSVTTGVGYLGAALALLVALTAMGLSFSQIALVASALSVGIGFGLQQIVQNFVSGVILLVERPVKVGDWVNVGGVEGDVRRIRVRATEIQTFDRATVIVPNANLITQSVQNMTLGNPRGRLHLQVSIANIADAAAVRELILEIAASEPRVLKDPPPTALIDSLAGGAVNFTCYAYIGSPRELQKVRSDLYFKMLEAFRARGVTLAGAAA